MLLASTGLRSTLNDIQTTTKIKYYFVKNKWSSMNKEIG